ncbi:MAG: hypothetical protein LBJ15_11235 [Comamonas sp.]|jgi:hypothetical protein|uniref:hypothetical protein n=1 Tax=Comamonas sp. TaxID=34028 RepID=UPI00282A7842|nr:hypothetical protein [Comamonas sp.]MDR0214564.1 hypothetical protein [Comamonas sp.]
MNTEAMIELTGTVAECIPSIQPVGDADGPRPVLQLVLTDCGPLGKRVTTQQVFPADAIAACHSRAAQLPVGTVVTVQAPVSQVQLHLPRAKHIRINKTTQEAAHV